MHLSTPTETRERLHRRTVTYEGFRRGDGLFDIEAHMVDVKDQDCPLLTGTRAAGLPIHDMWMRVTVDRRLVVHAIEAVTSAAPYPGACETIGPAYGALVGASLLKGFRFRVHEAVGGLRGCTHLTELLSNLPTAAVQALAGLLREDQGEGKPFQLDRCHALGTSTENVRRYYPAWYRPAATRAPEPDVLTRANRDAGDAATTDEDQSLPTREPT